MSHTNNQLLRGVLARSQDLIAVLDPKFRVVAFNALFAERSMELLGCEIQPGADLLQALAHVPEHQNAARAVWSRALGGESFTEVLQIPRDKGGTAVRDWEVAFYPLLDEQDQVTAAVHIAREVTARVHQEVQAEFALGWEQVTRLRAQERERQLGEEK